MTNVFDELEKEWRKKNTPKPEWEVTSISGVEWSIECGNFVKVIGCRDKAEFYVNRLKKEGIFFDKFKTMGYLTNGGFYYVDQNRKFDELEKAWKEFIKG